MDLNKLDINVVRVVVGAASIELYKEPLLNSREYATLCNCYIREIEEQVPAYRDHTTEWVLEVMTNDIDELTQRAINHCKTTMAPLSLEDMANLLNTNGG